MHELGECSESSANSRCLQHDLADAGHGTETVCGVLQWEGLILGGGATHSFITLPDQPHLHHISYIGPNIKIHDHGCFINVNSHSSVTSETKFVVAVLRVFSMGVASA